MSEEYTLCDNIFRAFLKNLNLGPKEMNAKLGATYNSVKTVYAKLYEERLLGREGWGNYLPNVNGILLNILDRVEVLERSTR